MGCVSKTAAPMCDVRRYTDVVLAPSSDCRGYSTPVSGNTVQPLGRSAAGFARRDAGEVTRGRLRCAMCEDTRMLCSPRLPIAAVIALLFLVTQHGRLWAVPPQELRGVVKDRSGAVIAKAQVLLRTEGPEVSRTTQADGSFVFPGVTATSGTLVVSASGFATSTIAWQAGANQLTITLAPAAVQQSLDVTATRTAILPTDVDDVEAQPDAVSVSSTQLQQWGALATDDKLRNVAGFSLLRRSGSQTRSEER